MRARELCWFERIQRRKRPEVPLPSCYVFISSQTSACSTTFSLEWIFRVESKSSVLVGCCVCRTTSITSRPHIVFIAADDLGWNDMSFHNPEIISPNLNDLAAAGVLLTDYHVYKVCSPTRASFMTGRLPNHAGLHDFIRCLVENCMCVVCIIFKKYLVTGAIEASLPHDNSLSWLHLDCRLCEYHSGPIDSAKSSSCLNGPSGFGWISFQDQTAWILFFHFWLPLMICKRSWRSSLGWNLMWRPSWKCLI